MGNTYLHVVGARPNFMKIAPLLRHLDGRGGVRNVLVHTGQHYDQEMSGAFFSELGIRQPDYNLEVGSGSHTRQTAEVMLGIEGVIEREAPAVVIVVGDVNSTVAAALVAAKMRIPLAHVEAGLRSRDREMPEELNRLVTDQLSDFLLTPSRGASENLRAEGISEDRIHFVGNIMIDSLLHALEAARSGDRLDKFGLRSREYVLATIHRPSNVDDGAQLTEILEALKRIARGEAGEELRVVLPLHPRTRKKVEECGLLLDDLQVLEPVGYLDILALQEGARVVLTDSGGIQEETTVLGVPCLTLRDSTERPITVAEGTNRLVPCRTREKILSAVRTALVDGSRPTTPEGWDGRAAERIAEVLEGGLN